MIRYTGDVDKPYNVVIFYLPGSIDSVRNLFFIYKVAVTQKEFEGVKSVCENTRDDQAADFRAPLEITIFENGQEHEVFTNDKYVIQETLQHLFLLFKGTPKEKSVREPLEDLLRRMGILSLSQSLQK